MNTQLLKFSVCTLYFVLSGCNFSSQKTETPLATPSDSETSASVCGNGEVEVEEECDDGNTETESCVYGELNCTVCNSECVKITQSGIYCGDGFVNGTEQCDDGNTETESCVYGELNCTVCNSECDEVTQSGIYCGDGFVNGAEQCDDGNTETESCGVYGEVNCTVCNSECDEITQSGIYCGDGLVQPSVEECDDAEANSDTQADACRSNCVAASCADGVVDSTEGCDDGNTVTEGCDYGATSCAVCSAECTEVAGAVEYCGDGLIQSPVEECDNAGANSDTQVDACRSNCLAAFCGDGVVDSTEECDDSNDDFYDGCTFCAVPPEGMVYVQSGPFMMGCNSAVDNECRNNESPYHQVVLDGFFIDIYEVTTGQYKACIDAGECSYNGNSVTASNYIMGRYEHPMNYVNWGEAQGYCEWLGKNLPTEAQWEKASRGTEGQKYPWGNIPAVSCDHAVIVDYSSSASINDGTGLPGCGAGGTMPVGSKPLGVSPYGAYDMIGNLSEWTTDWFSDDYYDETPDGGWANPQGPSSSPESFRTIRGGGFGQWGWGAMNYLNTASLRSAARVGYYPSHWQYSHWETIGFRCAKSR